MKFLSVNRFPAANVRWQSTCVYFVPVVDRALLHFSSVSVRLVFTDNGNYVSANNVAATVSAKPLVPKNFLTSEIFLYGTIIKKNVYGDLSISHGQECKKMFV